MLALLLALAVALIVVRSRELHAAVNAVFVAAQEMILNRSAGGGTIGNNLRHNWQPGQ